DIETVWVTRYEAKARRRTLRGLQRFTADTSQVFATDRFYMPTHDLNGNEMEIDETLEIVEAVPFDYESQKNLPRYRIRLVSKPANHHYEVDALRIGPGGSLSWRPLLIRARPRSGGFVPISRLVCSTPSLSMRQTCMRRFRKSRM